MSEPEELIGLQLTDRLRLSEFRGRGPNGWVYTGELLALKRPIGQCAIKLVFPRGRQDPDDLLSEIRSSQPNHPGIVAIHSSGVVRNGPASGSVYLQMELAAHSLQQRIDRRELLDPEEARGLLRTLAEALGVLHQQGRSHANLRPTNVLLIGRDWRLSGAELLGVRRRLEEFGPDEHLFVYRAPETFESGAEQPSIDIWSLGVVIHMATTGRLPFEEAPNLSKGDMIWRILNQEPRLHGLTEPLGPIVRGCMIREPSERLTAAGVVARLEGREVAEESPGPAVEPSNDRERQTVVPAELTPRASSTAAEPARPPAPPVDRALWQTPGFAGALALVMLLGFAIGWWRARPPLVAVANVPPGQLYTVDFDAVTLDAKGRIVTRHPSQTAGYAEDLGQGVKLQMVQIPGGTFEMGSPPDEPQRDPDESPQHLVTLRSFYMSQYEITQRQWRVVAAMPAVERELNPSPSHFQGQSLPVESVSWYQAREFCLRLSRHSGRAYRLPTEAEWEYACRARTQTPFSFGSTLSSQVANYQADSTYGMGQPGIYRLQTVPVGSLGGVNAFGLYDMHGNVAEWCRDSFAPYPARHQYDPTGPQQGTDRVFRGGGWDSFPWMCRSAARAAGNPDLRRSDLGFRVVLPEMVLRPPAPR